MNNQMHETISFDAARAALKGASDLPDTIQGGLRMGDRVQVTVQGNVTERKQVTRPNNIIEWVKVIEVDNSYDMEVLNRISLELPYDGVIHVEDPNSEVVMVEGQPFVDGKPYQYPNNAPLTVDGETGEIVDKRPPGKAREPAREGG